MPLKLSLQVNSTSTSVLFHPFPLAAGVEAAMMVGLVASYLKLYEALPELPALSVQLPLTKPELVSGPL